MRSEWVTQGFVQSDTKNPNAQPIVELRAFTGKKNSPDKGGSDWISFVSTDTQHFTPG